MDVRVGAPERSLIPFDLRALGKATLRGVGDRPVQVDYDFDGPGEAVATPGGLKVVDLTIGGRLFSKNWVPGNDRVESKSGVSATLIGLRRGVHSRAYVRSGTTGLGQPRFVTRGYGPLWKANDKQSRPTSSPNIDRVRSRPLSSATKFRRRPPRWWQSASTQTTSQDGTT